MERFVTFLWTTAEELNLIQSQISSQSHEKTETNAILIYFVF